MSPDVFIFHSKKRGSGVFVWFTCPVLQILLNFWANNSSTVRHPSRLSSRMQTKPGKTEQCMAHFSDSIQFLITLWSKLCPNYQKFWKHLARSHSCSYLGHKTEVATLRFLQNQVKSLQFIGLLFDFQSCYILILISPNNTSKTKINVPFCISNDFVRSPLTIICAFWNVYSLLA